MQNKIKFKNWDFKNLILDKVKQRGGWVNTHSHLDRAYTLTKKDFHLTGKKLQEKWQLVDEIKSNSSVVQIYDRMAYAIDKFIKQGTQAIGTFIDVDDVIKDKAIQASEKIKKTFKKAIHLKFINQVLKGVINKEAFYWFKIGASYCDIIGGLPGKDRGKEQEHIDILLDTAKSLRKMVHVHVDQLNTQKEKETELLVQRTQKFKMNGKVVAIHGISIAAHPIFYRNKLYKKMKENKIMLITCPSAWIDSRRNEELTPTHNSIAPIEELVYSKITVGLGTDNIFDIYKPFTDGDMWTELRFLLETCHFYDIDQLVNIAANNGLKVLGIGNKKSD